LGSFSDAKILPSFAFTWQQKHPPAPSIACSVSPEFLKRLMDSSLQICLKFSVSDVNQNLIFSFSLFFVNYLLISVEKEVKRGL